MYKSHMFFIHGYNKLSNYFCFPQNNPLGLLIINAFAVDDDVGANGVVDYSILPNFDYSDFTIDPVTGNITILVSADREIKDSYTVSLSKKSFSKLLSFDLACMNFLV